MNEDLKVGSVICIESASYFKSIGDGRGVGGRLKMQKGRYLAVMALAVVAEDQKTFDPDQVLIDMGWTPPPLDKPVAKRLKPR